MVVSACRSRRAASLLLETDNLRRASRNRSLIVWTDSWAATGRSFRSLNTAAMWQTASEQARVPLGPVVSRTLIDQRDVPAPPNGYRMVRFKTDFANKAGMTETLSLDREGDGWKVVGIYIE